MIGRDTEDDAAGRVVLERDDAKEDRIGDGVEEVLRLGGCHGRLGVDRGPQIRQQRGVKLAGGRAEHLGGQQVEEREERRIGDGGGAVAAAAKEGPEAGQDGLADVHLRPALRKGCHRL